MTNAWLSYALIYQCGHVMQFEPSVHANWVTSGNIVEIIMGRALTTHRYDIYDHLQRLQMNWFWTLKRCHAVTDQGPRWTTYEHPKVRGVQKIREIEHP